MPSALFTDFYELTMLAGYRQAGIAGARATFDLFFRKRPQGVALLVAAGQEAVLAHLEGFAVQPEELDWLREQRRLPDDALAALAGMRFTGDVWAVPEGTPVFPGEPVLRVEAPLGEAQVVETALLNAMCYASLIASHAVDVVHAAAGRTVLEFGARRAHGPDGALTASRAAYLGGCDATSNVDAGRRCGIPVSGTQAHAWIMAFTSELEAFRAYARTFPDDVTLLVDTYDTLRVGIPNAITVGRELAAAGHRLGGVRLDSGDLGALASGARRMLDAAGLTEVAIVASGDLDAGAVRALVAAGAPIDGFGVGTALVTAAEDPTIAGVYKLAELDGVPVLKLSATPAKTTDPGRKQVWRGPQGDVVGLADEHLPGRPLLEPMLREGRRVRPPEELGVARERCRTEVAAIRPLLGDDRWPVERSPRLVAMRERLQADLADGVRGN